MLKKRPTIPQITKVRALLQKEINSACPINRCGDRDVQYFEIHHIDSNTTNNKIENLILICRKCHSKISSGEIEQSVIRIIKDGLSDNGIGIGIEFVSLELENNRSGWKKYDDEEFSFYATKKKSNPTFMINFVNHIERTIVLSHIKLKSEAMFMGFSGRLVEMKAIASAAHYSLPLIDQDKEIKYPIDPPIQIPAASAARFSLELHEKGFGNEQRAISGRWLVEIVLCFGRKEEMKISRLYLNCKNENDRPMLVMYE